MEVMNKEIEKINNNYNEIKAEILTIVEERTKRIEEKIDRQLKEHQKQMKLIIKLLSAKKGKKERKMIRKGEYPEERVNSSSEDSEEEVSTIERKCRPKC